MGRESERDRGEGVCQDNVMLTWQSYDSFPNSPVCCAAGIVIEEKNWPPFFPIIHHDIAKEIPIHLQRMQYVAFATWLGM